MAPSERSDQDLSKSNFDVDYVIHYEIPPTATAEAEAAFIQLITALSSTGFTTEVRRGRKPSSLLIFTKLASPNLLRNQVYRARVQDWLYGVRPDAPAKITAEGESEESEPITPAERLRVAYLLITRPKDEGGAGVSPANVASSSPGVSPAYNRFVKSIFAPHDKAFNRTWLAKWTSKYQPDDNDLSEIRDQFGEKVALYFAFLREYSRFLLFPAAFGFAAWLLLGPYSWVYAVVNALWGVVFFEYWKVREEDLAVSWGVRGVGRIQHPRPQFKWEREGIDPVTGQVVKVYSPVKRFLRQLLQIPFAAACVVALGGVIVSCFAIEIFITEVYNGPFKQYLTFLPTIILTIFNPTFTALLTILAERLTELENYETQDAHMASFVQKIFVINFITSYLGIFLTAFVYVPFAKVLVPYLDIFQFTVQKFTPEGVALPTKSWEINPDRLTKQVIYFTVTAQIVNLAMEVIMPWAKRKAFKTVEKVQAERNNEKPIETQFKDDPQEAEFLERIRDEAELEEYDVTIDYREMVIQFGYLSLFSVVWPLTAISFIINNWIEARSDAVKIITHCQRPIPWRSDTIGPWLRSLGFLSWLGSITSSALVFLFHHHHGGAHIDDYSPWDIPFWALLLTIMFAEHVYLGVQIVVRGVLRKVVETPGLEKERAERFALRKMFERTGGVGGVEGGKASEQVGGEKITRESLEDDARRLAEVEGMPEKMFWLRQRNPDETIQVGRAMIAEFANHTRAKK